MPDETPSKLVSASEANLSMSGVSKIKEYNLEDLVIELHSQSYSLNRIADACNKELESRKDGVTYLKVNAVNVRTYLKKGLANFELSTFGSTSEFNFDSRVTTLVNLIESELDKCRSENGAVNPMNQSFFVRLLAAYKGTLEMYSKAKDGATDGTLDKKIVNIFMQKITNISNKVKDSDLPAETKGSIIKMVLDEIPTIPTEQTNG